jgi:glucose-6-phosphate 1-dehydrogenase
VQPPSGGDAQEPRPFARLIVVKPLGHDLDPWDQRRDRKVFGERDITSPTITLRETVRTSPVRNANSIFEPLFNRKYVDHVQIAIAEAEGVATRAGATTGRAARTVL